MKLREFNFNSIKRPIGITTLEVRVVRESADEKPINTYMGETIGDTLRLLPPELADAEILEKRWYFNIYVITVKENAKHEDQHV